MITYHYYTAYQGLKYRDITRQEALEARTRLHTTFQWSSTQEDVETELSRLEAEYTEGQRIYVGPDGEFAVMFWAEQVPDPVTFEHIPGTVEAIKALHAQLDFGGLPKSALRNAQGKGADTVWQHSDVMQAVAVWLPKRPTVPVVWLRAEDCGGGVIVRKMWRD